MKERLVVLLLVLGGLGAYAVLKPKPQKSASGTKDGQTEEVVDALGPLQTDKDLPPQPNEPLPGEPPEGDPIFNIETRVYYDAPQFKIEFTVTEEHGWMVSMVYGYYWHESLDPETGKMEMDTKKKRKVLFARGLIERGKPLKYTTTLSYDDEIALCEAGKLENWVTEIAHYYQVRQ